MTLAHSRRRAAPSSPASRLDIADFAADVRRDLALAPKQLQSKYLYDALGSSLFEAICRLPWYRITRAERGSSIATRPRSSRGSCARRWRQRCLIVELGCGSGEKIVILAEALQSGGRARARVHLIDISSQALEQSERTLGRLRPHLGRRPPRRPTKSACAGRGDARHGGDPMLVLLLGSNIGNFDMPAAHEFLCAIRGALRAGRRAAARRRSREAGARPAARLRRSARRHRGVQPQPARPDQPRARRHVRPRRLRARRGLEPAHTPRRDAPREPRRSARDDRHGQGLSVRRSRAVSGSGPRARAQLRAVTDRRDGIERRDSSTTEQWIDDERALRADRCSTACRP